MRQLLLRIGTIAVAIAGCGRESTPPAAPDDPSTPEAHGRLVYSGSGALLQSLVWSGHTDRIYFVDDTRLQELEPASGAVRKLSDQAAYLVMTPNGRALYYADRSSPYWNEDVRIDLETEQLTPVSGSSHGLPVASNRDDRLAYARDQDYALVLAASTGSNPEVIAPRGYPLVFSPDDRQILYALHPTYAVAIQAPWRVLDLDAGSVREVPIDVPGIRLGDPHWGANGITIAFQVASEERVTLWVRNENVDRPIATLNEHIDDESTSWSLDGARFAFLTYNAYTSRERHLTAWVVELEASRALRVAHGLDPLPAPDPMQPSPLPFNQAALSPDGRSLAYTSGKRIFVASIE